MEWNIHETERGQVGIGTLIVFIAMVLVAAIAAGVLINTAGFLQTQAEDTGQESTQQVADALNVQTAVGVVGANTANNDEIGKIRMGVQPASGADDINLAELTLQYVSDKPDSASEFANIVVGEDSGSQATGQTDPTSISIGSVNDNQFNVEVIKAQNQGDLVMSDNSDRYAIIIPLAKSSQQDLDALTEGSEVELTITTEVGSQTTAFLQVPDSLSAEEQGDTVNI